MKYYFMLFSVLLLISLSLNSFATVINFTTDKSLYHLGDIKITANVNYDSTIHQ